MATISDQYRTPEVPLSSPLEDRLGGEAGAHAAGRAGGQVDLAEQQDEDQPHRDDRDVRALAGQVTDVVAAEETVADLAEDRSEHDQAEDGGQRSGFSRAQADEPALHRVRHRPPLDVQREVAGGAVAGVGGQRAGRGAWAGSGAAGGGRGAGSHGCARVAGRGDAVAPATVRDAGAAGAAGPGTGLL